MFSSMICPINPIAGARAPAIREMFPFKEPVSPFKGVQVYLRAYVDGFISSNGRGGKTHPPVSNSHCFRKFVDGVNLFIG